MLQGRILTSLGLVAISLLIVGVAARLGLGMGVVPVAAAATPSAGDGMTTRTVTVGGQGEVRVKPDLAVVTFGVEASNVELVVAQRENAARMEAVLAKLTSLGIAEQDLQTVGYTIFPEAEREGGQPSGYRVTNTIRAPIHELGTVGATLDATAAVGANRVVGIVCNLADRGGAMGQAREAAVRDERAKAEQYAGLMNGALGDPLEIVGGGK